MSKADSIKARLRNLALQNGKPYEYVLTHYFIQRVLYRISVSPYSENFVLKGGLLLQAVLEQQARATRDIDLLAQKMSNHADDLLRVFRAVCDIKADDGVTFDLDTLEAYEITREAEYRGIRLSINVFLDHTRGRVHIDIGFGDVVVPHPHIMSYPVILDMEEIQLQAYSLESVISEKFHAMVDLAHANSRMKDFYDIAMLASTYDFDGELLRHAIQTTFRCRRTTMPETPAAFTENFAQDPDKQRQWQAFIRRTRIQYSEFDETLRLIRSFLQPLYQSIKTHQAWSSEWRSNTRLWTSKG